jgi:hypothetical protein
MKVPTSLNYKIRSFLAKIPLISQSVFYNEDEIFHILRDRGFVQTIRKLDAFSRARLHFTLGMSIRNEFLLWHPSNPHTMKRLAEVEESLQPSSVFHPDNYSWLVVRRLLVAAAMLETTAADVSISASHDASEALIYSLLTRADDKETTLQEIDAAVRKLIEADRFDLLDDVFEECINYNPSPAKLSALLHAVGATHQTKLTPVNYLKVAQRAIGYGVEVPK